MKKFIILFACILALLVGGDYLMNYQGIYIDFHPNDSIATFTKTEGKTIYLKEEDEFVPFEIKGVDMGAGIPGHFATDYAIDEETYLRWFKLIQEMGANTIRVYTILGDAFYNAFYEYNLNNEDPLYLLHGVWVNDYIQNSHRDAYDSKFLDVLLEDCKILVDVIHGERKVNLGRGAGSGVYTKDISQWVLGYIVGVEWEDVTVAFTDHMKPEEKGYQGKYMKTTEDATPFESMLARVGDQMIAYESTRYKQQRLMAFSNWPTTDPFDYPENIRNYYMKIAKVDVEHIQTTEKFLSGQFASYHIYPYYPDYLTIMPNINEFVDKTGKINTYYTYLKKVNDYHTMPVIISEFGVPSARGMAQKEQFGYRSQGALSEKDQGKAIADCYQDIKDAGCAGSVIFTWQDEWFKRTWNTMHAVDLNFTPFWSDYQTNEQYFGLLSFDPGKERSISYVDGDLEEWSDSDLVIQNENSSLSMKYDEKFIYFLVYQKDFSKNNHSMYIPLDITPKSGSNYYANENVKFQRDCDFIIKIDGKENSRVLVQERYDVLKAMYSQEIEGNNAYWNPPPLHTSKFNPIELILQFNVAIDKLDEQNMFEEAQTYETGLLTYGNANPGSPDFNSLADFCFNGDYIEIKLPWQLLNFSSPSEMKIHDDYYENYGVENLEIDSIYAGIGTGEERIQMNRFKMKGWGRNVTYHERLKSSYYAIKECWGGNDEN